MSSPVVAHDRSYEARLPDSFRLVLLLLVASLWLGMPRSGIAEAQAGPIVLVGDVLRFNQRNVWSRIAELAPDLVIIAAASDRPALYGEFARRALERHGVFAELLPLAIDTAEFGIDHRRAVEDRMLVDKTLGAAGVFFVGGAPQRLAEVLLREDGSPTPMGSAIAELHGAGGVIIGGIPGSIGLFTGVDALEVLSSGRIPPRQLFRGLGLVSREWFIDQHAFSPGRLAEMLVAMRQLGIERGIGIGADTAAVIGGERMEVVGDEGILLIDLSETLAVPAPAQGFGLAGARLSYLEHGDRFDMSTLEVEPSAVKLDGFEIESRGADRPSPPDGRSVVADFLAAGQLPRLLREALDGTGREAFGFAFPEGEGHDGRGFRFHFRSRAETAGWLSVDSGMERYTMSNVGLEVAPVTRREMPKP